MTQMGPSRLHLVWVVLIGVAAECQSRRWLRDRPFSLTSGGAARYYQGAMWSKVVDSGALWV
jgi:hypothetical protein